MAKKKLNKFPQVRLFDEDYQLAKKESDVRHTSIGFVIHTWRLNSERKEDESIRNN